MFGGLSVIAVGDLYQLKPIGELQNRLQLNEMTEEDKQMLQTRVVDRDTGDYPKDALHLFVENSFVD